MYLTLPQLLPYLCQKGVVQAGELLHHRWQLQQADPRRAVVRAVRDDGRGWIVKQPTVLDSARVSMLDREASVFELARRVRWARPWAALLPTLRLYDPGVHALITHWLPHDNGWVALRRGDRDAARLGAGIARALHRVHVPVGSQVAAGGLMSDRQPSLLRIDRDDPLDMDLGGIARLTGMIRSAPGLLQSLSQLSRQWRTQSVIHGDAKLDNVLLVPGPATRVYLLDWAFCGLGDPAWDIGCVLQSCLLLWLGGLRFDPDRSVDESLHAARLPIERLRTVMSTLLASYAHRSRLRGASARAWRRRAVRYAGAAMVQAALTHARLETGVSQRQLAMLQMGANLMQDPDDTLRELSLAAA